MVAGETSASDRSTIRPANPALQDQGPPVFNSVYFSCQRPLRPPQRVRKAVGAAKSSRPDFVHKFYWDDTAMQRRLRLRHASSPDVPHSSLRPRSRADDGADRRRPRRPTADTLAEQAEDPRGLRARRGHGRAGEDIVVVGRHIPNVVRATPQVVSVLSSEDIARTGEGDIAGALDARHRPQRRGRRLRLCPRAWRSLFLLAAQWLALPSPEPLRRSVPLDIFPTCDRRLGARPEDSTRSNYPGEFGGGVDQPHHQGDPGEDFVTVGGSISADTAHDAASSATPISAAGRDWLGYRQRHPQGARFHPQCPGRLGPASPPGRCSSFPTPRPRCSSATITFRPTGRRRSAPAWRFDLGSDRLGVIDSAGASNTFRARSIDQQDSVIGVARIRNDFHTLITDNRIIGNAPARPRL